MFRTLILAVFALLAVPASAAPASNELMYVQGRFVGVHPTGMHIPTWIFVFRTEYRLHGVWQVPTPRGQEPEPMDDLVRFALPLPYGGYDLIAQVMGTPDFKSYDDVVKALSHSPAFRLVLWRLPADRNFGDGEKINAELVGCPVPVRK